MKNFKHANPTLFIFSILLLFLSAASAQEILNDPNLNYSTPWFSKTSSDKMILTWIEKDESQAASFVMATSTDNGLTFTDKKTIINGFGVSSSRLMRSKVLEKRNGELVAVFMYNPSATAGGGGRRRGGGFLAYSVSKNGGEDWTAPKPVDTDPDPGLRGFFDAVVLANDEVAVVYLKDVKNSTKFEERDLRLVITKDGVFQPEKLIDAVVCDCCNISMLVEEDGTLNIYYRDNNKDIRDIAHVSSKDNGQTFSESHIVYADHWEIQGCPHNGSVSAQLGDENLVTWYSAGDNEPGIRLVTEKGKKLSIIGNQSAMNPAVASNGNQAVFYWEDELDGVRKIAYQIFSDDQISDVQWIAVPNGRNAAINLTSDSMIVAVETGEFEKPEIKIIHQSL